MDLSSFKFDFGSNRKRVCDFLLVRHSNLGPILQGFGDIAGFVLLTPPLFHANFGVFPLNQIAHVAVNVSRCLELFGCKIIFEVCQLMCSRYLIVTDGQTDDILWHNRALRSIARKKLG